MIKTFIIAITVCTLVNGNLFLKNREENEIGQCEKFDICNVVYRPHWGKNIVERLCTCPNSTHSDCPADFSREDGQSLLINARTQIKFCSPLEELYSELPECVQNEPAIKKTTYYYVDQIRNITAQILCACNKDPIYWKYHSRDGFPVKEDEKVFLYYDFYECTNLRRCETNEFCGFARTDYGFVFQRCTCKFEDDCKYYVEESEIEENIEELFYSELMYKSHCLRDESSLNW